MTKTKLYFVPTPIGNLEDITFRAIRILKEVDEILAEDTRTSGVLLQKYGINTPMRSFHAHNEHKVLDDTIERLKSGVQMALISDAGMPGISDPGFLLAREALKNDLVFEVLPGASAFLPALLKSGLPCDQFVFEGFLPHKKGRQTRIKELNLETRTVILYESPHRLLKLLTQIQEVMGEDRIISVSRELTKKFEETITDSVGKVAKHFAENPVKGEIVVVLSGNK